MSSEKIQNDLLNMSEVTFSLGMFNFSVDGSVTH